jgi:beta-glucosidase
MDAEPLYPFGFGLSYTKFTFHDLTLPPTLKKGQPVQVAVTVTNTGHRRSDEVVELYVTHQGAGMYAPHYALKGFHRINLAAGESRRVHFTLTPTDLSLVDSEGHHVQPTDELTIAVGGSLPDARSQALGADPTVSKIIHVE